MKLDKETQERIQELQIVERNLQNFAIQKQAFQIELNEVDSSLKETEKAEEEVYRIIGQVMIKAKKPEIQKELQEKKEILGMRIKALENQEGKLMEKFEKTKKEIEDKLKSGEK